MLAVPQFLARRRLILANLVLGVVFVLVAVNAACPLLVRPGHVVGAADLEPGHGSPAVSPPIQLAMLDQYARVITINDVFVHKALKPPVIPPVNPPPEDPEWRLVGTWEAEGGAWQAAIFDKPVSPRGQELMVHEGARLRTRDYAVLITQVTEDFVRFEIHTGKHPQPFERILTWSGIVHVGDEPETGR